MRLTDEEKATPCRHCPHPRGSHMYSSRPPPSGDCLALAITEEGGPLLACGCPGYEPLPAASAIPLPIPEDPEEAVRHVARALGHGFHPDTRGADYLPPLPEKEARAYDLAITKAFLALGDRVYEVGLDELWSPRLAPCPACGRGDVLTYRRGDEAGFRLTFHDGPGGARCEGGGRLL